MNTKFITRVSVMSVLGYLLMFLQVKLPLCPPFMEFDLGDLPALIGTLIMGPVAGVWIELIKNILHAVINGSTGGVGEFSNFICGCAYLIPIGIIHNKNKNLKFYTISAVIGSICMIILCCFTNYFIMIPLYIEVFGMPLEAIVDMTKAVNPYVTDLKSLIVLSVVPFNIFKALILSISGYILYKFIVIRVK